MQDRLVGEAEEVARRADARPPWIARVAEGDATPGYPAGPAGPASPSGPASPAGPASPSGPDFPQMFAHRVQREEELFRHAAADVADQAASERDRFVFGGNPFRQVAGDLFAVERDAIRAVPQRGRDRFATADHVADAVVEVSADEIFDFAGFDPFREFGERRAVGGKVAVEADALRRGAVALERIAREGGPRGGVDPDEAVVVVPRRGDGGKAAFQELALGEPAVRHHALEIRLRRRGIAREARPHPDRHGHRIAQRAGGGVERGGLDSAFFVQGEVAADVVAVYVRVQQPGHVARREAEVREGRQEEFLRFEVRRIDQDVLVPADERDARPDGTEGDFEKEGPGQDFLEGRSASGNARRGRRASGPRATAFLFSVCFHSCHPSGSWGDGV